MIATICLAALVPAGCAARARSSYSDAVADRNYGSALLLGRPASAPISPARTQFEAAWKLLDEGQYARAEGAFADWLESHGSDPQAPEAMFFLAYARQKQGRDASAAYRQLIDRFPDSPSAAAARRRVGE